MLSFSTVVASLDILATPYHTASSSTNSDLLEGFTKLVASSTAWKIWSACSTTRSRVTSSLGGLASQNTKSPTNIRGSLPFGGHSPGTYFKNWDSAVPGSPHSRTLMSALTSCFSCWFLDTPRNSLDNFLTENWWRNGWWMIHSPILSSLESEGMTNISSSLTWSVFTISSFLSDQIIILKCSLR